MFGIRRRGLAPALFALSAPAVALILLSPSSAKAGELDDRLDQAKTLFGGEQKDLTLAPDAVDEVAAAADEIEKIWAADFHPETDRWTERNNRIKITFYPSLTFFGGNLRLLNDILGNAGIGGRISWEVPGFIGIRLDNSYLPFTRMIVRNVGTGDTGGNHHRNIDGFVDITSFSIAIFNPELSFAPGLAMWAGFGVDWFNYHFTERLGFFGQPVHVQYQYIDYNFGGNFFFNLEYKITDIFHVGFEWKEHIIYCPQTERGEFYKTDFGNGSLHTAGSPHSRNQNIPIALSMAEEFQLHFSVLF